MKTTSIALGAVLALSGLVTAAETHSHSFVVAGAADLKLTGGSSVASAPLASIRSCNPGQHSVAALLEPLSPGTTVQSIDFAYRYDTGYGAAGSGTGTNFSLRVAGVSLYSSPHLRDYAYDNNRSNYSQPIAVHSTAPVVVPTTGLTQLEFHFDCNDRNVQLLLPLVINVTCAGGASGGSCAAPKPAPTPAPPRQYCPAAAAAAAAAPSSAGTLGDVANCLMPDGSTLPCGPTTSQVCPPGAFGRDAPQFHVRDASCGENDPNGPVYDPVHGVYHLHYQNHVGCRGGRTYGHAVSRDFVHWAHMPVSIWNDHPYDEHAIYTGSATVVDGRVVQVYPGLCYPQFSDNCPGGTNLAIAVPANVTDPLQTNWTKDAFATNPIVNNTGRDPSTAWQTPAGEWRLTTFDTIIMGSMDFKSWYRIGKQPGFVEGECPSFFPLPRVTPGAGPAPAGTPTPTHVHKASHGGKDWMQVGTYVANGPRQNGNWTALLPEQIVDAGNFYASKDFHDPVGAGAVGRRINWGWATVPPASTQSLPREVTWHPELQQLVFSPVEEQAQLRGAIIGSIAPRTSLPSSAATALALGLPAQKGNQSEVRVSFDRASLPHSPVRLSVHVMADVSRGKPGTEFYIEYAPTTPAGMGAAGRAAGEVQSVTVGGGGTTAQLNLLPGDKNIDLVLYVDNTFTEAYWMSGRAAMTVVTPTSGGMDDVTLCANDTGVTASATAWEVRDIWVTPEEVKNMPRRDQ